MEENTSASVSSESANDSLSSLRTIATGAGLSFVGVVVSRVIGFVFNILLTRTLTVGAYGLYAYGNMIVSSLSVLASLGSNNAILRYLPMYEDDPTKRNQILGLSYLTASFGSAALAGVLIVATPTINDLTFNDPRFSAILYVFSAILFFNTIIELTLNSFRGLEVITYPVVISQIVQPITRLSVVGVVIYASYSLLGFVNLLLIGYVFVCVLAVYALVTRTPLNPEFGADRRTFTEYYKFTLPLTAQGLGALLYNRMDVLMVGFFLFDDSVAIYNIATLIAGVILLPHTGFNQLSPSIISKLYSDGDLDELNDVFETITRWTFTAALLLTTGIFVYRTELLSVFGSAYAAGGTVIAIIVVGQLLNAAVGPAGYALMMTGHQYAASISVISSGVLNVVLNFLFIQEFGLVGAALATAAVIGLQNVAQLIVLRHTENLFPYSFAFIKPIVASIGAGAAMIALSGYFSGYSLLLVGGAAGSIVFVVILLGAGVESEDIAFFNAYVRPKIPI